MFIPLHGTPKATACYFVSVCLVDDLVTLSVCLLYMFLFRSRSRIAKATAFLPSPEDVQNVRL